MHLSDEYRRSRASLPTAVIKQRLNIPPDEAAVVDGVDWEEGRNEPSYPAGGQPQPLEEEIIWDERFDPAEMEPYLDIPPPLEEVMWSQPCDPAGIE
ncbi:MAG: hypothetical protein ACTS84_02085, partial [Arsenophonus sp. NC-LC2-MAG3]